MNVKKNAKNANDKALENPAMMCNTCGAEKKPYKLIGAGKKRMVFECKCGFLDKSGGKI